jgi:hypothetical protein
MRGSGSGDGGSGGGVGGEPICNANAWLGFRDPVLFGGLVSSGWGGGGIWSVGCRSSDGSCVFSGVIRGLSVSVL